MEKHFLVCSSVEEARRVGSMLVGNVRWNADLCSDSGPEDGDWVATATDGTEVILTTADDLRLRPEM